jgi:hypothetical protein
MPSKIFLLCIILFTAFTFGDSLRLKEAVSPENTGDADFLAEQILSDTENAYNPIPSPDGKTIAYVETGWGRNGAAFGLGRSNLKTNIKLMDTDGKVLTEERLASSFLHGWTADGENLIAFRDWGYLILSVASRSIKENFIPAQSMTGESDTSTQVSERFAYLEKENSFLWIQNDYKNHRRENAASYTSTLTGSTIKTSGGDSIPFKAFIDADNLLIPSPDGRYIAMIGTHPRREYTVLQIYDRNQKTWTNLGQAYVHADENWDYLKPSWNPWFADSSKVVFISPDGIAVSAPDGKDKKILLEQAGDFGIPVPSPDGKNIAYVSYEPRPKEVRPDLKFYGGTIIRVIDSEGKTAPRAVTGKSPDETYCLRWLNNRQIVFDRIADESYYKKARLWKADVFPPTK